MATSTPWGPAQTSRKLAPGIMLYTTAAHGGIHLSAGKQAQMPEYLRCDGGWYEEDCAWALVALVFPQAFTPNQIDAARDTAKSWYPDQYARFTGSAVPVSESYVLRERAFHAAHAADYVAIVAWGDWQAGAPAGHVLVAATVGGMRQDPEAIRKYFLVTAARYDARDHFGYVIDPSADREVSAPK